jgi:hypothetical protein
LGNSIHKFRKSKRRRRRQVFGQIRFTQISAARLVASIFGILAGMGGIMHGPGEILQGNVAPGGIAFNSWTVEPIATNVGGEPAMTLIPNLLISGILTILMSLAVLVWAAAFVGKRRGGVILILLSLIMLLVGGGFAPPLIGIIAGVAGLGINAQAPSWYKHLPSKLRNLLAAAWPWFFGICVINGVFLIVGTLIFGYIMGLNIPDVWVFCFLLSIPLLILTILTGVACDSNKRESSVVAQSS